MTRPRIVHLLLFLLAVLLGWLGLSLWHQRPRHDVADIEARARAYDARIVRDSWGVPHVFGKRDADVAFGFAYAHAEDDYATIQDVSLAVRGRLASWRGADAAAGDYLVQLLRIWPVIDERFERDLPADVRAVMQAYADGLNLYAVRHPEEVAPGLLPYTGRDVAAGFLFKLPLFYGFDRRLQQVFSGQPVLERTPTGSNGVAVAPARSSDGATRLLVNSHQPYTGPVAWYEAVLESEEGWHVAGGFFPGAPFMLHGHNTVLGWANTVNEPDLVDVYRLEVDADDRYLLDGHWQPLLKDTAWLWVKLWGPFLLPVPKATWRSAHGPMLRTEHGDFALRYAGMDEVRGALQVYRLNKARSLSEWQAAMRLQAIPALNYVYADAAGNIGYVYNGLFPRRQTEPGLNWQGELPGNRSELIWHDYLPFEQVPQRWNPPSGVLFNANGTPFHASAAGDDLDPALYPASMGIQTNLTNRARRMIETYGSDRAITPEAFRRYKYDLEYSAESEVARLVREMTALPANGDTELAAAQALLARWDRRADRDNREAAVALLAAVPVARARDAGTEAPTPLAALKAAIVTLKTHFGRLDPRWGDVNRIRRGSHDLAIDGAHDTLRSVWGEPRADGRLVGNSGDTFIQFVSWDRQGRLSSESIHQFGSTTLAPASAHYADQLAEFVAMRLKPVWFTRDQLAGHIEREYRPGEEGEGHGLREGTASGVEGAF